MRYLLIALIIAVSLQGYASAQLLEWDEGAVKQLCESEWQDDFSMQEYCVNTNKEGHADFMRFATTADMVRFDQPFSNCIREWGIQWEMVAYCAERQLESFESLPEKLSGLPSEIAEAIMSKCSQEWRDDYSMIAYCAETQSKAWKQLNN